MSNRDSKIDSAIENGNLSNALKLLNKKIEQNSSSSYFKAQKCRVLQMDGQIDEGIKYCKEVVSQTPSDPDAIELLISVFQDLEIVPDEDIFEKAVKKYPTLALIYRWFTYCVNNNELIGLQKSTMMLTKSISGNGNIKNARLFKIWSSFAMMINVKFCAKDLKPTMLKMFPMLALKMMETVDPESSQEMYVYIQLLRLNGKLQDACDKLSAFLDKENDLELKIIYFELLQETESYDKLYEETRKYLVQLEEDDWDTWKLFIKSAFQFDKVEDLMKTIEEYKITRNSQLAYLEVYSFHKVDLDLFVKFVANYIDKYGSKLCCFLDLKIFDKILLQNKDGVMKVLEDRFSNLQMDEILAMKRKPTEKDLNFLVNYLKFIVYLNQDLMKSSEFIKTCMNYYNATKILLNKKEVTEYFAGFEFIILAIQSLVLQTDSKNIDKLLLIKCIILLEHAVAKDHHEFHLRLWLISLYKKLNCYTLSKENYTLLKIKILQTDTLSSILTTKSSLSTTDTKILNTSLGFYNNQVNNDCPELNMTAFHQSTFNKLEGFIEFYDRLDHSITKYFNIMEYLQISRILDDRDTVDYVLPELIKCWNLIKEDKIIDNRDSKTIWDCGIHEVVKEVNEKLFQEDQMGLDYLKYRTLKELVTYQTSRLLKEQIGEFLNIDLEKIGLSPIGKWQYELICFCIDETKGKFSGSQVPPPSSSGSYLDNVTNEYYFTLVDTFKTIQVYLKNPKSMKREKVNALKKISVEISSTLRTFRNDTILEIRQDSLKELIDVEKDIGAWFESNKSCYGVDSQTIDDVFDKIRESTNQSYTCLRKI